MISDRGMRIVDWKRAIDAEAKRLVADANETENVEQLEAIERDLGLLVAKLRRAVDLAGRASCADGASVTLDPTGGGK
jgi:hypothetical protein